MRLPFFRWALCLAGQQPFAQISNAVAPAGSLFSLAENTEDEVQFTPSDPDGVSGSDKNELIRSVIYADSVTVHTRAEPRPSTAGRTLHVHPPGHQRPKQDPAFLGLHRRVQGAGTRPWRLRVRCDADPLWTARTISSVIVVATAG